MILTSCFVYLSQLLSCLRAEAASAAGAEANEPHAPPPSKDACDASARMVDELMPAAVAFLGSPRESTVMAAMPVSFFLLIHVCAISMMTCFVYSWQPRT